LSLKKYRPDIDGLRAIAVISVVTFHAFPGCLPGGFVGVDIFFVISGFLISSIVFSNIEQGHFSILSFYNKRIRRIFPALVLVMLTSFVFGWFSLLQDEFEKLGEHLVAGAAFVSNFALKRESGYFDSSAELKPMLHLWSLAIEEQFYIFWPLLLVLVWKYKLGFLRVTAVIAAVSFSLNVYLVGVNPTSAFYFPFSRFWELMVGGVLAYRSIHCGKLLQKPANALAFIGITLLLCGFVLINRNRLFPGFWALLPSIGAYCIIAAGPDAWLNKNVLSARLAVWFGLISYPLYLWHWPVFSFAKIVLGELDSILRLALVGLSIMLAYATYRFIELPLRFGGGALRPIALVCSLILVAFAGFSSILADGYPGHGFRDSDRTAFSEHFDNRAPDLKYLVREQIVEKNREKCNFYDIPSFLKGRGTRVPLAAIDDDCVTPSPAAKHTIFLWGDSHSSQLYFGLKNNLPTGWEILQVTSSGCAPDASVTEDSTSNWCVRSNWYALEAIKRHHPDVVVVSQNVGHSVERIEAIAARLNALGVERPIFTGPTPHWSPELPKLIQRRFWDETPRRTLIGIDQGTLRIDAEMRSALENKTNLRYISLVDYFCDRSGCLTYIGDDRMTGVTSWDYGHLTPIASDSLARDRLWSFVLAGNHGA
jgi:peptidoglycan/LPS O-acetylase OafA/YrhL